MASWSVEDRASLATFLSRAPRVTWFGELGGDFQFGLTFAAYSLDEFLEFRDQVSRRFSRVIASQTVATRAALWTFPRKYLWKSIRDVPAWFQGGTKRVSIDATDAKLLDRTRPRWV